MNNRAAVITVSDKGYQGKRVDTSGPALEAMLEESGWEVIFREIVPDETEQIKASLIQCADKLDCALVLTTGGTGFSPRDVTPEATRAVILREAPGIPEAMRSESMKITPRGCLSRGIAGIRGKTLMVNLPGSEKAAREHLNVVLDALWHGAEMIQSNGSADCGQEKGQTIPSMDLWLREAKADPAWDKVGMYLIHNGVVRSTPKGQVRFGEQGLRPVTGMQFTYNREKLEKIVAEARCMKGIYYIRVWLNQGYLSVGENIMYVLMGGDIRPNVIAALESLVGKIKREVVTEIECME